jgi:molybdenum cofactor synthesis domain-containing protein
MPGRDVPASASPAGSASGPEARDVVVSESIDAGALPAGARALVLTVSDGVATGSRADESGIALGDRLAILGFRVDRRTVSDERPLIESALREAARDHVFVISTGGTGLTPRDVTPQATLAVVDYEVPGLAEAMRAFGRVRTPMADLSRGVVGVIGKSLIVNVPGSPEAAVESFAALEPTLGHALETLAGPFEHETDAVGTRSGSTVQSAVPSAVPAATASARPAPAAEPSFFDPPADDPAPFVDDNDEWRDLPEQKPD